MIKDLLPSLDNPDPPRTQHRVRHFCTLGVDDPKHSCKSDGDDGFGGDDDDYGNNIDLL